MDDVSTYFAPTISLAGEMLVTSIQFVILEVLLAMKDSDTSS